MKFICKNSTNTRSEWNKLGVVSVAYSRISSFPLHAADIQMNNYLLKTYNKSLKDICKYLIMHKIKLNNNKVENIIFVTFTDLNSEKLAKLITFGNESVSGSHILQYAFDQDY